MTLLEEALDKEQPRSIGLIANAADVYPELVVRGVVPDVVTDQTPAHDPLSYVPRGLTLEEAEELRERDPAEYSKRAMDSMAEHVQAMLEFRRKGAVVFDYGNIRRNLGLTLGLCLTERVMLELVRKGVGRQEAHEMLRRLAMRCWNEGRSLREVMLEDPDASGLVEPEELDEWLKPENYIGTAVQQVDRVVEDLRGRFP
jgi:hypothetical protein